ncbi:MAG: hypothetical protein K2L01_02400 [Rikenellaceae bacterium]|nr:hypothetical protein [Rikenellaceae bacterium]
MKNICLLAAMAVLISAASCRDSGSGPLSEAEYLHLDSLLWMGYEARTDSIYALYDSLPEKRDSLTALSHKLLDDALAENVSLALRYASVPSGLQRVFMVRMKIPKDTLRAVLGRIPAELASSPYADAIRMHIDNDQIEEGSRYYDFTATLPDSTSFTLSSLGGKKILLLYGGLGCMGEYGRSYLASLRDSLGRDSFDIVAYQPCSSLEELKEVAGCYPLDVIQVSELKGDVGPFKILYGAQATPTCFLIDRDGVVVVKTEGLDPRRFAEYL